MKSWKSFQLNPEHIFLLKTIRCRYSDIRNNQIGHISDNSNSAEASNLTIDQVAEDIIDLRNILNMVRKSKNIPSLFQGYNANDHYAVKGMELLFEQLLNKEIQL